MNNPLHTSEDYELFLYTLKEKFSSVRSSTIFLVRRGATLARVKGELCFDDNVRIVVRERILYDRLPAIIDWYGCEIWQGKENLCWYDSQPHPGDANLSSTHPHHKHIPPNIKQNRIPAPFMTFTGSNILTLINEVEKLIKKN
ncbi:MAG: toxin-antitoxin system TumE family protein [Candidatus Anammoxibacter sp.]